MAEKDHQFIARIPIPRDYTDEQKRELLASSLRVLADMVERREIDMPTPDEDVKEYVQ